MMVLLLVLLRVTDAEAGCATISDICDNAE